MALIDDIAPSVPELGILRMGEKGKKGEPVKLLHWRITSYDPIALDELAALYGGTSRPWEGAPEEGQFELYTEASAIDVLIPPNPITAFYERWAAGGCQKRCDGVTATIAQGRGDAAEIVDAPCWCRERGLVPGDEADVKKGACDLYMRLRVALDNVSGLGYWRLNTSSVSAYSEIRGQIELLRRMLPARDANAWLDIPAQLAIEQRRIKKPGQPPREFIVPVLRTRRTLRELVAAARAGDNAALVAGEPVRELESGSRRNTIEDKPEHVQQLVFACSRAKLTDEERHRLVSIVSNGRTDSSREVTVAEAMHAMEAIDTGEWHGLVHPTVAAPAEKPAKPRQTRASVATALTADEQAELQRLRTTLSQLPAGLRERGLAEWEQKGFPEDPAEFTSEHLAPFGDLVERLHVEHLEATAACADAAADPAVGGWGTVEWTAAARDIGFTQPKVIKEARRFAELAGIDVPGSLDGLDERIALHLHEWLRDNGAEGSAA